MMGAYAIGIVVMLVSMLVSWQLKSRFQKYSKTPLATGMSGAEPATLEEREFLGAQGLPVRATGTRFGHTVEAAFPLNLGLAALSLARKELFPPMDGSGNEVAMSGAPSQIMVISTGHWRGEGVALVDAAE